ncbi:MAG: hypothetical protein AVDCRST_MAG02-3665, partial [uncultured Rubrobacteraceae bacterium]
GLPGLWRGYREKRSRTPLAHPVAAAGASGRAAREGLRDSRALLVRRRIRGRAGGRPRERGPLSL